MAKAKDKYPGEIRWPPLNAPRRKTLAECIAQYQKPDPGPPKSEYQQRCELRLTNALFGSRLAKLPTSSRRKLRRLARRAGDKPKRHRSRRHEKRYTHPTMRRRTIFLTDEQHGLLKLYGAGNFSQGLKRMLEEFGEEIRKRLGQIQKETDEQREEKVIRDLTR